ncbi:TnpV protein [Cellulomonas sp. HD19AZ1]|uniref:TnpV protein n=1 Tax=Cellulomonas sp. HD19AZ1 TaxID=2559593 RepID=UPI00107123E0|nr:TnpV protein [Cellulomonas sp. HD19AZ1]TFH68132.1 TnpV protein [Cellulomonas sp. HD19AZ1]
MSAYERTARTWWQQARPNELLVMQEPEAFFRDLSQQIESRVSALTIELAGPDEPGEDYLAKVGRLNRAQTAAQEMALDELVFSIGPESEPTEPPSEIGMAVLEAHQMVRDARD